MHATKCFTCIPLLLLISKKSEMVVPTMRWLLHSACPVLGYPHESKVQGTKFGFKDAAPRNIQRQMMKMSSTDDAMNPSGSGFRLPLHYPRYEKADYQKMEEWKLDLLPRECGLRFEGTPEEKRAYAVGAFLWPDQP